MIKGTYFLKSLKLFSFGLLISFIMGVGNFSNSYFDYSNTTGGFLVVNSSNYDSVYNPDIDIQAIAGGNFKSTYLGDTKNVLALSDYPKAVALFWWTPSGVPYFYSSYTPNFEGYFSKYALCDEITGTTVPNNNYDRVAGNCVYSLLTGDSYQSYLKSFFSKFGVGDIVYYYWYDYGYSMPYTQHVIRVCYSSSELHKSLCFNSYYDNRQNGGCVNCIGELINSQNYYSGLNFANFNSKVQIGFAPGQLGYGDGGDLVGNSTGSVDNVIVGDYIYSTCTYGDLISYIESAGWSKYMCYGGLDNFDLYDPNTTYNPIPGTGKTLNEILQYSSSWSTPKEWYTFWRGLFVDRYNNSWNDMWSSYPAVYRTWFEILDQYGGLSIDSSNFNALVDYCTLKTTLNINPSTIYNGQTFAQTCQFIINGKNNGTLTSSGEVIEGVNWEGVGTNSGGKTYNDGSVFMQDYFNKLKENLKTNYSGSATGALPTYIITFLLAIILFKFLRK